MADKLSLLIDKAKNIFQPVYKKSMSSSGSRCMLQPPMNTRTPPFSGSKLSPATENLAEGSSPVAVTFAHKPVSEHCKYKNINAKWRNVLHNVYIRSGRLYYQLHTWNILIRQGIK